MPSMMMGMFPLEVIQSKGRVTIIEEAYNQVRRIYLGEPQIAIDDAEPGFFGHSVGHWEGDTLVTETVGIKENVRVRDVPHSSQMRVTERLRLIKPGFMEDRIVVTDPVYLAGPWAWTWEYQAKPGYHLYEYVCEDNREYADPTTGQARLRHVEVGGAGDARETATDAVTGNCFPMQKRIGISIEPPSTDRPSDVWGVIWKCGLSAIAAAPKPRPAGSSAKTVQSRSLPAASIPHLIRAYPDVPSSRAFRG